MKREIILLLVVIGAVFAESDIPLIANGCCESLSPRSAITVSYI